MILFGHLGLTAGAVKAYETTVSNKRIKLTEGIDYRFVLLGSVLPDLIDKPIGAVFLISTYHNGRIYAHTLLFSLLLLLAGVMFYRKRKNNAVLILWGCAFIHLLLDSMWVYPETLFWPFWNIGSALAAGNGWAGVLFGFPYRYDNWLGSDLESILRNPTPLLFELAGIIILLYFFVKLARSKGLGHFFRTGKL